MEKVVEDLPQCRQTGSEKFLRGVEKVKKIGKGRWIWKKSLNLRDFLLFHFPFIHMKYDDFIEMY